MYSDLLKESVNVNINYRSNIQYLKFYIKIQRIIVQSAVTLCGWYARQAISLSVLAWNPNKGLELEICDETGSGGGRDVSREERGELAKEPREGQSKKEPKEGP